MLDIILDNIWGSGSASASGSANAYVVKLNCVHQVFSNFQKQSSTKFLNVLTIVAKRTPMNINEIFIFTE